MTSMSKCIALVCLSVLLLTSAGAMAALDEGTTAFIRRLGTDLGTGWDANADPCTYDGITCVDLSGETFQGAEIHLAGRGLTGTLPGSNGAKYITKIDLRNNNGITGNFPRSWASMNRMTDIDLSNTQLTGQIPDAWNSMSALRKVKITNTKACYRLPSWSGTALTSIRTVDLSNNYIYALTASGFSALARSTTLQSVDIRNNPLCGCVNDLWRTNSVMMAAARAALPSSTDAHCFMSGGAVCPNTGVCLATSSTVNPSVPGTSTVHPTITPSGHNAASLVSLAPVVVVAAVSAFAVLIA